ncbi:MAG: DMT family transporter [Paracoccaceae bacterium]
MAGHAAMLAFSALVAGSFSLGALAANEIAPAALTAVRFLLAGALVGALALATTGLPRAAFRAPWRYVVLGALFSTYFVTMFEGLKTAPAISTAAVFTLTPLLSGAFGWLFLRQKTTPRMRLALAIGAAGALWVIFRADLSAVLSFQPGRGETIFFVGCVAYAAYAVLLRRLNRGEATVVAVFAIMAAGVVELCIYGWHDLRATDWGALPPVVWITLAYLAVFASAASFLLLQFAAQRLPAVKVLAYTYLTPSWVIAWEIVLGHGAPRGLTLVGVGLTVVALLLLLKDEGA